MYLYVFNFSKIMDLPLSFRSFCCACIAQVRFSVDVLLYRDDSKSKLYYWEKFNLILSLSLLLRLPDTIPTACMVFREEKERKLVINEDFFLENEGNRSSSQIATFNTFISE
jgi:hypothetical protein